MVSIIDAGGNSRESRGHMVDKEKLRYVLENLELLLPLVEEKANATERSLPIKEASETEEGKLVTDLVCVETSEEGFRLIRFRQIRRSSCCFLLFLIFWLPPPTALQVKQKKSKVSGCAKVEAEPASDDAVGSELKMSGGQKRPCSEDILDASKRKQKQSKMGGSKAHECHSPQGKKRK